MLANDTVDSVERRSPVAEGGVRTVAHGVQPWEKSVIFASPLERAKESFLSPAKAGSQVERNLLTHA
jgi:hypothetical protein